MSDRRSFRSVTVVGLLALLLALAACADDGDDASDGDDTASAEEGTDDGGGDETAGADDFPSGSIDFTIPYGPGGSFDTGGREFVTILADKLGTDVVVNNREGGGASVGTTHVVESEPDGHSIGMTSDSALWMQPLQNPDLRYSEGDYAFIGQFWRAPSVLFVAADAPWEGIEDFVEDARSRPGEIRVAPAAAYTTADMAIEMLNDAADIEITSTPVDGGGEALTQTMQGVIDGTVLGGGAATGQVEAGELKPLAVFAEEEYFLYPDADLVPDHYDDTAIPQEVFGIAPAGTPDDVLEDLRAAFREAIEDPDWQEFAEAQGFESRPLDIEEIEEIAAAKAELFPRVYELIQARE